jgi:inner membrane protein
VLLAARRWPLLAEGLLDEPAHLLTAALVLAAVLPARAAAMVPWALAGAVLIDLDHVPLYLWGALVSESTGRPVTHSATTVLVLALGALAGRGRARTALLGLSAGVALHLARDVATGPGIPLGWPVLDHRVLVPHGAYLAALAGLTVAVLVRLRYRARAASPA